jgi:hypothetical protein
MLIECSTVNTYFKVPWVYTRSNSKSLIGRAGEAPSGYPLQSF